MFCYCAPICARGVLRYADFGASTYRPRRPYTVPSQPTRVLLVLLLVPQCCGSEMTHELACSRARSTRGAVRACVRVVISERQILHNTKWAQSMPSRRLAPTDGPVLEQSNTGRPVHIPATSTAAVLQRSLCFVDMIHQQQIVRAKHGTCSVLISQ